LLEENAPATQDKAVVLREALKLAPRFLSRERQRVRRSAESLYRALVAFRTGPAHEGAEFHQRGVVLAGALSRKKAGGVRPELFASRARVDRSLKVENPGEDTSDVRFDDRHRLIEGERGHSIRGVTSDAGKITDRFRRPRKARAVFFNDRNGGHSQISGSRRIAEALPGVENVGFRGSGEGGNVRKATEPFLVIWNDRGDLSLLQHEFGDEDGVGIGSSAPRKIATVFSIPGKESAAERRSGIRIHEVEENVER